MNSHDEEQSKHGLDASEKTGADGSKQADNPDAEDVSQTDEGGGLGGPNGALGGEHATEPHDEDRAAERRK